MQETSKEHGCSRAAFDSSVKQILSAIHDRKDVSVKNRTAAMHALLTTIEKIEKIIPFEQQE